MVESISKIKTITNSYIKDVQQKFPLDKVILFGSYAKGTPHQDSDVDVCFFSSAFEGRGRWETTCELFYLKDKYDGILPLEPHGYPTSEIDNDNPFVDEIMRTGIELYPEQHLV